MFSFVVGATGSGSLNTPTAKLIKNLIREYDSIMVSRPSTAQVSCFLLDSTFSELPLYITKLKAVIAMMITAIGAAT